MHIVPHFKGLGERNNAVLAVLPNIFFNFLNNFDKFAIFLIA